jgi:hypothetical protein
MTEMKKLKQRDQKIKLIVHAQLLVHTLDGSFILKIAGCGYA